MADTTSTIERALQLAREGTCRTVGDIRLALKAERYEGVDTHMSGTTIQRQLKKALAARLP